MKFNENLRYTPIKIIVSMNKIPIFAALSKIKEL